MTTLKYPEKVELLKDAIDVSGKRLLPSKTPLGKIDEQIDLIIGLTYRTDDEIKTMESKILNKLLKNNVSKTDSLKFIIKELNTFFNIKTVFDLEFWKNFGSAPLYQKHENDKKKGGVGMDTIFGDKFDLCYSHIRDSINLTDSLFNSYSKLLEKSQLQNINVKSKYNSLDDLEDNVVAKKIEAEANIFYKDKTKPMAERLLVFEKYGESENYIHQPEDIRLRKIFKMYGETGYVDKYQTVDCLDVINWWVDELSEKRCKISYNENKYHPKIIKTKRKYTPSEESKNRLSAFYKTLLIEEGVARFTYDW